MREASDRSQRYYGTGECVLSAACYEHRKLPVLCVRACIACLYAWLLVCFFCVHMRFVCL